MTVAEWKNIKPTSFSDTTIRRFSILLMSSMFTLTGFVAALINGNTVAPPNVTSLSCSTKTIIAEQALN